ncbi:type II toxin-antitoxin system RelE/ParE family toxin [Limosilactobacillus reuteri]|uniref:type II toxin-antitoxin system RelE/ParE family toxin n=1 Tax=Limosilactobacillus reuteri TaxID=1598 RepID=UPI001C5BD02B|nr:type II toxin-antitoxin system RelE/ParE family toxin [Limosilactobacillus reuteri]MBW3351346.1 type II toxin-antitoxin system RelE/ParE family toxin [Limosilactobacillus reuteri]UUW69738.1 type II toxin-antitoxin system RelE/ParE family toxin [Limosilactobacillus reuteri]
MKDYQIRFRRAAKDDVASLRRYLERNFGTKRADEILVSLRDSLAKLGAMPELGRNAIELSSLLAGYRFLHLPKNTAFYVVDDEKRVVEIIRVFDNRMDALAILLECLKKKEK